MDKKNKITILTPASPGIKRSHDFLTRYLREHGYYISTKANFAKQDRRTHLFILPIHYFVLLLILKVMGFHVVFICHGRSNLKHNGLIKHIILTAITSILERVSDANIYVSNVARTDNKGFVFHNILNSKKFNLRINTKTIYYFGRICESKGVERILELAVEMPEYSFKFLGSIEAKFTNFRAIIENIENCEYKGSYDKFEELKNIVKPGSIFLSLNFNEPFGITYLEALELNLIPIVPRNSGFSEVFTGGIMVLPETNLATIIETAFGRMYNMEVNLVDDRGALIRFFKKILSRNKYQGEIK